MIILHHEDVHFDLIVDADSDLATVGSLSYRHNIGPTTEKHIETKKVNSEKFEDSEPDIDYFKRMLAKSEESHVAIQQKYQECVSELKKKTEEAERLKTELKDLKEIMELERVFKEKNLPIPSENEDEAIAPAECPKTDNIFKHKSTSFRYRQKSQIEEKEFNCNDCDYQGSTQRDLEKHIYIKHTMTNKINCRICGEEFTEKRNLMHHRKKKHIETVAPCRKKIEGQCDYSDEMCWWSHVEKTGQDHACYICGKTFIDKNSMMKHRKIEHRNIVKECSEFIKNNCRFQEAACWFKHSIDTSNDGVNESNIGQVFQKASENLKPPIMNHLKPYQENI